MKPQVFLALAFTLAAAAHCGVRDACGARSENVLELLPYPQEIKPLGGSLPLGPVDCKSNRPPSETERLAAHSLVSHLPKKGQPVAVRLGSVEEGYEPDWLTDEQRAFLTRAETSAEASVLTITPKGITVVGKGKWGMLYGVQTVNQLAIQAAREGRDSIPCLTIRDWPDAKWRCLAPQLAWYAGWGSRFEGYDNGNWSLDEWKWMVDWSLLHRCNAWAVCMYGMWPFTLPGYEEDTLDFDSFYYDMKTNQKTPYRYTHRNIKKEFLPELIRYANARGVQVHAYIGKNTFNGTYLKRHPEADAKSLVREAIPFTPGVSEYWNAFIKRILEQGFNGFVFEDPETYHVPNQNDRCYKTFWEPWAAEYGFRSVADTDKNKPPLGVHVEYYAWLTHEFDQMIRKHAKELGRAEASMFWISHILLNRIMKESKDQADRARWFELIDQKHGRKMPFVLFEDNEKEYVKLLGGDRAATLGGRGGAAAGCWRISNINNDRIHGDLGMDIAEERSKQRRMVEAGGFGSMAYIFQWTNTEVFGYLGAQHLWRPSGVPGINNDDDFGFLDYAYRIYYGREVGILVGKAYSMNCCVTENHVLEDDPFIIFFGGPLHRDFQLLAVMADEADRLAQAAYKLYTGREPDLYHQVYDPDQFRWNGYDASADTMFKTERLRLLCVSTRRSQLLCIAAIASRKAKQMIAEGGSIGAICEQLDKAVAAAKTSEILYFANYEDDYKTGDEGTQLRKKLEATRAKFLSDCGSEAGKEDGRNRLAPESVRNAIKRRFVIDWQKQTDILPETPKANKPGLYFSTDLGLSRDVDYFCLGAVFTVQARGDDGVWKTIFRRALLKKDPGWQHWDIPLDAVVDKAGNVALRLITDAYSRAMDRNAPTWKWGYWGQPRVVQVAADGKRDVRFDFVAGVDRSKAFVQLDDTGKRREFDGEGTDSTGATFKSAVLGAEMPEPVQPAIAAFTPRLRGKSGVTVAEYQLLALASPRVDDKKPASLPPLPNGVRLIPDIEYANIDGHSLRLDLYVPRQGGKPAPVILWIHGGGWDAGDRRDPTAIPLTAFGYAVASIDYRLSTQATFPAQIQDCKRAVRWLRTHASDYHLDGTHVGAWGASAGGHLAALLGTIGDVKELEGDAGDINVSSRVQAVCDWFGPADLTKIDTRAWYKALRIDKHLATPTLPTTGRGNSFEGRLLGGAPDERKEKAIQASPITYASKDDPPFLIMHGDRDPMMPLSQSELLLDSLKREGVEVKLHVVPGAGHGFDGPEIIDIVRQFFESHLKK